VKKKIASKIVITMDNAETVLAFALKAGQEDFAKLVHVLIHVITMEYVNTEYVNVIIYHHYHNNILINMNILIIV
jgi:hypothetical protein